MTEDIHQLARRLHANRAKKVYAYLRVSSDKQSRDGESLAVQEQDILAYCEKEGLDDPVVITEVSSAGKRMFSLPKLTGQVPSEDTTEADKLGRPIFMLLLGHLTMLKNCQLVVWKLDRFSRFQDEQEVLYQLMLRANVRLHSTAEGESHALSDTPDDPMATLMRQILGAFAQYERRLIDMRMSSGLRLKASKGGYTGGRPPYGYEVRGSELVVREDHARLVRYVFMLHRKYGMTQDDIATRIENALPEGQKFSRMKVNRILHTEELYRGTYRDVFGESHSRADLKILTRDDFDYEKEMQEDGTTED